MGLLPLSLLPTAPTALKTGDAGPLFQSIVTCPGWRAPTRSPWFRRRRRCARCGSCRQARTKREQLIGFGDPFFNTEQAAEQPRRRVHDRRCAARLHARHAAEAPRGAADPMASTAPNSALLPRLPDTADELKSIALALQADPSKVLNLGKDANEQTVKSTDLSSFKIVVFATHGLVPGELDGLTQPALALTAPTSPASRATVC